MVTKKNSDDSFVDSFKGVAKNLTLRYSINMHLDFILEFVKFADNTRDIDLQNSILEIIQDCERSILNYIEDYERDNKKNID